MTTSAGDLIVWTVSGWCVYESTGFHLGNIGIDDLASEKLTEFIDRVPKCQSPEEAAIGLLNRDSLGLPACIPPDIPATELLSRLGIDVLGAVASLVLAPIPDTIPFGDVQLRQALTAAGAGDNLEQVDEVRRILKDGWTYNQDDLRSELSKRGDDVVETLDTVREILRDGWTYTQDDLHQQLRGEDWDESLAGTEDDPVGTLEDIRSFLADGLTVTEADLRERISGGPDGTGLETFDQARDYLALVRTYRWLVSLPLLSLLVTIAFLGGRSWSGRIAWASGVLLVTAGLVFLIWGPGYDALAKSGPIYRIAGIGDLDELRKDALTDIGESGGDFPGTSRLAANKTFDIVESVADGFASGVAGRSLALAVIGLIALVTSLFWASINIAVDRIVVRLRERDAATRS